MSSPPASRATASRSSRPAAPPPSCARRAPSARHLRPHRLPGNDGRAGQDAPPQGPRRPPRRARQSRACRGHGRAWHRPDRPRRRQPLPVPRNRCARRRSRRRSSRISTSAARRWCAPRRRTTPMSRSSPIPPTMPSCSTELDANGGTTLEFRKKLAAKAFALTAAYDSTISAMVRLRRPGRTLPRDRDPRQHAQDGLALRRKPAPAGRALHPGRPARARRRPGRAGPGQGAQLQQPQRRRCRARAGRRVPRRPRRPWSSSSTPTRAASRPRDTLVDAWGEALGLRQRLGLRRDRRHQPAARRRHRRGDQPRSSPKWWSRPTPTTPPGRSSPGRRICGCC